MNLCTANIYNSSNCLVAVFSAYSVTAAMFAFRNSEHYEPHATLCVIDGNGRVVHRERVPREGI